MLSLANSEVPDEMPYKAFHQGLHYLLRQKFDFQDKQNNVYLEIIFCDPLIYLMDHPKFIVTNQKNPLVHKGIKI